MEITKQLDPYSPGGCFIATACYGSEFTNQVLFLKDFRDNFLANFSLGQKFIEKYYEYSPKLAEFIESNSILKTFSRLLVVEPTYLISKFVMKLKEVI